MTSNINNKFLRAPRQKDTLKVLTHLLLLSILLITSRMSFAAVEDLDQVIARKARQRTNTFYSGESASPYKWQPQTLYYTEITTGNEVWRMSNTPALSAIYHDDIGWPSWSSDGNRLAIAYTMSDSLKMATASFSGEDGERIWLTPNTDGSNLKPIVNGPARTSAHQPYFTWSPLQSDAYFAFGRTALGNSGVNNRYLYKGTITDNSTSYAQHLQFPGTYELWLPKSISADGKKVLAKTWTATPLMLYPASISGTPSLDDTDGYSIARPHDGTYWGDSASTFSSWHDQYAGGFSGGKYFIFILPDASHVWWKMQLGGTATDGGANHISDRTAPYNFGEIEPVNSSFSGNLIYNSTYWSHFVPDRWGRYALFTHTDVTPISPGIEDLTTHTIVNSQFHTDGTQHHDWHAWSDWFVNAGGPGDYSTHKITTCKYDDTSSTKTIANPHTLYNNGGSYVGANYEYNALARPAQSPDGTKVAFHSTFLNSKVGSYDDKPDVFWAVAYYPYPPEIKSAAKNGSNVRLTWDFNQGTAASPNHTNPRTYTKRGWPNETSDRPPSPREIKYFRVWSSPDNLTWSPIGTTAYNNCAGTNECGTWTETSWAFDVSQNVGTTMYYGATSLEHSGLESRTLSNIWKVVTDASGNITQQQQYAYPVSPGDKSYFYAKAPGSPQAITYVHKQSPATANGQYTITWSAPANKSLIRSYNIYAADGTAPTPIQQNRIASVPATSDYAGSGSFKYVDWLGKTDGATKYVVTSVDFQGNESSGFMVKVKEHNYLDLP